MIDFTTLDRKELKDIIKQAFLKDASIIEEVMDEIKQSKDMSDRQKEIAVLIKEDFNRFEDVFKALA